MDRVYQVFVSSTFVDLEDERRQVSNALAKAGYLVAGMELFPATDQQQLDFIKRVIDRTDYYVVIVGGRYGSLAEDNLSFTEHEFEYAKLKGIPVLAFLHKHPDRIEARYTDRDPDQVARLEAFRAKLRDKRLVEMWTDANDLCRSVLIAVSQATNLTPRKGWIRGDQAIDPRVLQEAERLRIENSDLRQKLEDLQGSDVTFDPSLIGPNDALDFDIEVYIENGAGGADRAGTRVASASLGEVFVSLYDLLLTEPEEYLIRQSIGAFLGARTAIEEESARYAISDQELIKLRYQFEALGLIQTTGGTTMSGLLRSERRFVAWRPTEKGRRYVIQSRSVLRRIDS
ncbi:DUF4062 domain-containing protein [Bradyrhizobium sp. CB1717]|uniref:DUF4062 domain-containing protein n=1 Tax=Bradyrhizobium sp. CB1717 TaxID=3039154 RepID=UPI0024B126F0|nr:DUF4062 domain-containing protein [Bradyrhizobium sp. CB1717]WFU23147.1 DUF4062 domain-containing protein [Bradyrhizobium sp. CB1717]